MGEGAGTEDKTTLAQKDIRFARTIQRLQRVVLAEKDWNYPSIHSDTVAMIYWVSNCL